MQQSLNINPQALVRDLVWAVSSPSLLSPRTGWPDVLEPVQSQTAQQHLARTDPSMLSAHLAERETRFLGKYFEALWEFYFLQDPRFEIVARGLQVHDGARTLGELDFVVWDEHAGTHLHVELAVKFYLGVSQANDAAYTDGRHLWVGPQVHDRLDRKVSRTLEHQIPMSQHPLAVQRLAALGVTSVQRCCVFKGCLFQPERPLPLPDYIRADGHGNWRSLSQMAALEDHEGRWRVLDKREWLSPTRPAAADASLNFDQLLDQLRTDMASDARSRMVICAPNADSAEVHRYFVTPDEWPNGRAGTALATR